MIISKFLKKYNSLFFFVFLFGIFFINRFEVIDRVATHWFFLSIFNLLLFFYLFILNNTRIDQVKSILRTPIFISIFGFLFFLFLSYIYAFNLSEFFIKLTQWLTIFMLIFLLSNLLLSIKFDFKYIILTIVVLFSIQLFFSLYGYLSIISQTSYNFDFAKYLSGVTANKNIAAALFISQAPFALLMFSLFKNKAIKFLSVFILFASFYSVFVLSSRSAYISLLIQSFLFLFFAVFYFFKYRNKSVFSYLFVWFGTLMFSYFLFSNASFNDSSVNSINRLSSINTQNESTSIRIRYYKQAFDYVISNPFNPVGLGNYKIKSIEFDKNSITDYTVPYHAHNDFLEIAVETGFFGFLFYFLIFFVSFYLLFNKIIASQNLNDFLLPLTILLSGASFFIDSNLNFPHARVIQMVLFCLCLSIIIYLKLKPRYNG